MTELALPPRSGFRPRVGRLALCGFGIVAFGLPTLLTLGYFLLTRGIPLDLIRPVVERTLVERAGADSAEVGAITLLRDPANPAALRLRLQDVVLDRGTEGRLVLPGVALRLDPLALLRGQPVPRHIEIVGAHISVVRTGDEMALEGRTDRDSGLDLAKLVSEARRAGFEGALLRDVAVSYRHAGTGAHFEVRGGQAKLTAEPAAYRFELDVPLSDRSRGAGLQLEVTMSTEDNAVAALLTAVDVPAEMLLPLFLGDTDGFAVRAGITGTVSAGGQLQTGFDAMRIAVDVGPGAIALSGRDLSVAGAVFAGSFEPIARKFDIERLDYDVDGSTGTLAGQIGLNAEGTAFDFRIKASDLYVDLNDILPEPLPIDLLHAEGRFDLQNRALEIRDLSATYFGAVLRGYSTLTLPAEAGIPPGVDARFTTEGVLSPAEVLRGWPIAAADGARSWIMANLPEARVHNVVYTMRLAPGDLGKFPLAPDAELRLDFAADDATVIYVPGMTPITGLDARGTINGNSFFLEASDGQVGPVRVVSGQVDMPMLVPKGHPAYFRATFDGELPDILRLLDEEPLGYMRASGLDPRNFRGRGQFALEVVRPMLTFVPLTDYRFSGEGTFSRLRLAGGPAGIEITDGVGTVKLTTQDLHIGGTVNIAALAARFDWHRGFGGDMPIELTAVSDITPRAADALGVPLRRFLRGQMRTRLEASGTGGRLSAYAITGDLLDAALTADDRTFLKSRGTPGNLSLQLRQPTKGGDISLDSFRLTTPRAHIEGNARLGPKGALIDLELPRLFIDGAADLAARIVRTETGLRVSVPGGEFNASGMIEDLLKKPSDGKSSLPGAIDIDISLQDLQLRDGVHLRDVALRGHHDGERLTDLSAHAAYTDGGALDVVIVANPAGIGEDIKVTTDRFGHLLRGVFDISSVNGGAATLTATKLRAGNTIGTLRADAIMVRDAPVLARLLSIGSLDGLANLLSGAGIAFDGLAGDFQLSAGRLNIVNAHLTGPALGLSANGNVDLRGDDLSLYGAVAPAYAVNSLLGQVPALGALLVSREGEGVLAFAYRLEGPTTLPQVTVNTIAALAPGVFRRAFEPVGPAPVASGQLLQEIEAAAAGREARETLSTPEQLEEYETASDPPPH